MVKPGLSASPAFAAAFASIKRAEQRQGSGEPKMRRAQNFGWPQCCGVTKRLPRRRH